MKIQMLVHRLFPETPWVIGRSHVRGKKETIITKRQSEFAEFVESLKQKRICGEEYREKIRRWKMEHQNERA
jgi:hypothetical protein